MRGADAVRLIADDPAAAREVRALAAEHGWRVAGDGPVFEVSAAAGDAAETETLPPRR